MTSARSSSSCILLSINGGMTHRAFLRPLVLFSYSETPLNPRLVNRPNPFRLSSLCNFFVQVGVTAGKPTPVDKTDLSRVLSLIITVLTDPYDQFIDQLYAEGRITEEEVQHLRAALNEQIPKLSQLIKTNTNRPADS